MFLILFVSTVKWRPKTSVVISDSARWSKPSTGGRTEDEAHNFDRIVNSWYLTPEGTKFSHHDPNKQEVGFIFVWSGSEFWWYHSHADPIWPDGTFKDDNYRYLVGNIYVGRKATIISATTLLQPERKCVSYRQQDTLLIYHNLKHERIFVIFY